MPVLSFLISKKMSPEITLLESRGEVTQQATPGTVPLRSFKSVKKLFGALRLRSADGPADIIQENCSCISQAAGSKEQHSVGNTNFSPAEQSGDADAKPKLDNEDDLATKHSHGNDANPRQLPRYESLETPVPELNEDDVKKLLDQATAFIPTGQGIPTNLLRIAKPVIIPRVGKGATAPIHRAWASDLAGQAITEEEFISFIDNLNILSQPPAHAVVLHIAAIGIGCAPFDGAEGVAAATELAAHVISRYTVRTRCQGFLTRTNSEFFHPRNLHARLLNSKAMRQAANIPEDDTLVAPLSEHTLTMSPHERCLERMKRYSCELSADVPDPTPQTKVLQRLAAWNVRSQNRSFGKAALRARKRAWKKHGDGKKLEREGKLERKRVKKLQWLVVQDLSEVEKQERAEEGLKRRISTWETIRRESNK